MACHNLQYIRTDVRDLHRKERITVNELEKQYPNFARLTAYLNGKQEPRNVLRGILFTLEPSGERLSHSDDKAEIGVG